MTKERMKRQRKQQAILNLNELRIDLFGFENNSQAIIRVGSPRALRMSPQEMPVDKLASCLRMLLTI